MCTFVEKYLTDIFFFFTQGSMHICFTYLLWCCVCMCAFGLSHLLILFLSGPNQPQKYIWHQALPCLISVNPLRHTHTHTAQMESYQRAACIAERRSRTSSFLQCQETLIPCSIFLIPIMAAEATPLWIALTGCQLYMSISLFIFVG